MSEGAEILKLVHDAKPAAPQCPHCKYFVPGRRSDPGGRCKITMMEIKLEREDYDEDQSCGPEARWFKPRDAGDEPVAEDRSATEKSSWIPWWVAFMMLIIGMLIGMAVPK